MADKKLPDFFDISLREQLDINFNTVPSDKVFLFSGPPKYTLFKDEDRKLCPLVFTTRFNVNQRRQAGPEVGALGTTDTGQAASPGGDNSIQVGSYAIITGNPSELMGEGPSFENESESDDDMRWNLLKRMYYDAITFKEGELIGHFLPSSGGSNKKSANGFKVVGKSKSDLFTNFSKSEFYDVQFGILAITMTKGHGPVLSRYYEGVKLVQAGAALQARVNSVSQIQSGMAMSFSDEVPLNGDSVFSDLISDNNSSDFMDVLKKYMGESS